MLEKTTRMNLLYDFYSALLTDKQRMFMELYYYDDLSLAEIAEQYNVSRQAVHDNIRRSEAQLEEYEAKLHLLKKYEQRLQLAHQLMAKVDQLTLAADQRAELLADIRMLMEDDIDVMDENLKRNGFSSS